MGTWKTGRGVMTLMTVVALAGCGGGGDDPDPPGGQPTASATASTPADTTALPTDRATDRATDSATGAPTDGATEPGDTFVLDGVTYLVDDVCAEVIDAHLTEYRAFMVEQGGGRAAFDLVIGDENPAADPEDPDALYFELYGPGDGGVQFSGSASHDEESGTSFGSGEFDQGGTFSYAIALASAPPC